MPWISASVAARLRAIPHFNDSRDSKRDLNEMFGFYMLYFVEPLAQFQKAVAIRTVADIGTGYGWLAIAFALATDLRIIALDPGEGRLAAAREIAGILGVEGRIEWRIGSLGNLPLADQEVDASYCVEVIEHTGDRIEIVRDLARVTSELLVVTTPNKWFPVLHHDTRLPFCHWLPPGILRDYYAAAFGRSARQANNRFWTARKLLSALPDFQHISGFLQFPEYDDYLEAERRLSVAAGGRQNGLDGLKARYYRAASLLGRNSIFIMPTLSSTFRRQPATKRCNF